MRKVRKESGEARASLCFVGKPNLHSGHHMLLQPGVLKLDLGNMWVSQAEELSDIGKALPAVSLPKNSHFVH